MGGIRPMVVCGPSGVGKGTLIAKLMARVPRRVLAFCRPAV
jgi:guanylate kinase